jgi:phosphoglycerate-specific signal transduction histidine kinase
VESEQTDYRQVGRELYAAIRRLSELQHLYESHQWPPAMRERFDIGLSSLVADPDWRQGTALDTEAQKACAAALEADGMSAVAARQVAQMKRDLTTLR